VAVKNYGAGTVKFNEGIIVSGSEGTTYATLIVSGAAIFNEEGSIHDFRVESDSNAHMLFVDGANDRVGVGSSTPISLLDVSGKIAITSEQGSTPSAPGDGEGWLYTKTDGKIYWQSFDVAETDLTSGSGGGGGSPGGSDGQIQYNNNSSFGGTSGIFYDDTNNIVGIGTTSPKVGLDVHHDPSSLANDTGGGEVITFGTEDVTDTLAAGKLMCLDSGGIWKYADANIITSGSSQMIAIALGTTVANGLLIRGFFDGTTELNNFIKGEAIFVSTTAGKVDTTAPSTAGNFVRVVGWCTDTANVFYFNPSGDWVELG